MAGQTVQVRMTTFGGGHNNIEDFEVEDWWDHLTGKSWMISSGNFAAMNYAMRSGFAGLPTDDEVVYGHIGALGYLVHVSEFVTPQSESVTLTEDLGDISDAHAEDEAAKLTGGVFTPGVDVPTEPRTFLPPREEDHKWHPFRRDCTPEPHTHEDEYINLDGDPLGDRYSNQEGKGL